MSKKTRDLKKIAEALERLGFKRQSQIRIFSDRVIQDEPPTFCHFREGEIWATDPSGTMWSSKDPVDVVRLKKLGFKAETLPEPAGRIPLTKDGEIVN